MSSLFPPKVTVNLGIGSTIYLSNSILAGERNRKYVCIYGVFCQINILSLEMQIISKLLFSDFLFTWPHFFFLSKFNQIQMFLSGNCMIILFPRQLFSKLHLPGCLLGQAVQVIYGLSLWDPVWDRLWHSGGVIWWSRWLMLLPHWSHGPSHRDFLHVVLRHPHLLLLIPCRQSQESIWGLERIYSHIPC